MGEEENTGLDIFVSGYWHLVSLDILCRLNRHFSLTSVVVLYHLFATLQFLSWWQYFFLWLIADVLCKGGGQGGFYEAWWWWQSMLDKWQSDNETAGQWLKRGHESQERGQDGVCLFTMHKHKVRSDFCYFSLAVVLSYSVVLSLIKQPISWHA